MYVSSVYECILLCMYYYSSVCWWYIKVYYMYIFIWDYNCTGMAHIWSFIYVHVQYVLVLVYLYCSKNSKNECACLCSKCTHVRRLKGTTVCTPCSASVKVRRYSFQNLATAPCCCCNFKSFLFVQRSDLWLVAPTTTRATTSCSRISWISIVSTKQLWHFDNHTRLANDRTTTVPTNHRRSGTISFDFYLRQT